MSQIHFHQILEYPRTLCLRCSILTSILKCSNTFLHLITAQILDSDANFVDLHVAIFIAAEEAFIPPPAQAQAMLHPLPPPAPSPQQPPPPAPPSPQIQQEAWAMAGKGPMGIRLKPCEVCGDKSTGYHFGVISCEACKVRPPLSTYESFVSKSPGNG